QAHIGEAFRTSASSRPCRGHQSGRRTEWAYTQPRPRATTVGGPRFALTTYRASRVFADKAKQGPTWAPVSCRYAFLVTPLGRGLLAEAVATVNGPVAAGPEGHLRVLAALRANGIVHLAWAAAVAAATAAVAAAAAVVTGAAGLPAVRAALRLVGVSLFAMVLLVVRAERERCATVHTRKGPVLKAHG